MNTRPSRTSLHSAGGFSIIEVVASLAIFGIVAAGLAAGSVATTRHNRVSHQLSAATTLAQDQIEQLRALDPGVNPLALAAGSHEDPNNPMTVAGATGGPFTRRWTVTRDSPIPGLATVTVTVSWTDEVSRTVRLMAYVCQVSTCN